jgi:hypothetical protein
MKKITTKKFIVHKITFFKVGTMDSNPWASSDRNIRKELLMMKLNLKTRT